MVQTTILKGIGALLEDGTPMVLVLDDLHWVDSESVNIICELFRMAQEKKWPLMFLSTCWNSEWYLHKDKENGNLGKLISYINNQEEHHRKKSFAEEYDEFIKKYGFTKYSK